jgi:hypothetical protein
MIDESTDIDKHRIFALIGEVANEWAMLEFDVNETIWELANVEQQAGACITSCIGSMNQRTRALSALVGMRGGKKELLGEITKFINKIDGISRQRNRVVHDPWYIRNDTNEPHQLQITVDKTLEFDFIAVPTIDVEDLIKKMKTHIDMFHQLKSKIFAELPPFDRTHFQQSHGIWDRPHRTRTDHKQ